MTATHLHTWTWQGQGAPGSPTIWGSIGRFGRMGSSAVVLLGLVAWLSGLAGSTALAANRPPAAGVGLERTVLYGYEFVDLEDWAETYSLSVRWDKATGELRLTNRWTRLVLTIDSRRAEVDGVLVWLSVPVTPHGRRALLACIDVQTLLRPLLNLPRNPPGRKVLTVALDPGHGGRDPGNEAAREQEKRLTLLLAGKVRDLLQEAGLRAVLTRTTDKSLSLASRNLVARRMDADLFVSLHYNSSNGDRQGVRGVEVYCLTPAEAHSTNTRGEDSSTHALPGNAFNAHNLLLAYRIQAALVRSLDCEDRGVRRARFAVLRNPGMPAVLVEAGFMSDPREAAEILDESRRETTAQAIVDGVLAYKRFVERQ